MVHLGILTSAYNTYWAYIRITRISVLYQYKNFELKRGWAYNTSRAYNTYYMVLAPYDFLVGYMVLALPRGTTTEGAGSGRSISLSLNTIKHVCVHCPGFYSVVPNLGNVIITNIPNRYFYQTTKLSGKPTQTSPFGVHIMFYIA